MDARNERGQAVVEFVLLFPLVLGPILALVEFGFLMYAYTTVTGATREAARFAAVANPVGSACQAGTIGGRAVEYGGGNVACGEVAVEFVDRDGDAIAGRGDGVVVRVVHRYATVTPLGALWSAFSLGSLPATFTISACAASRLELASLEPSPAWGSNCN